MNEPYTTVNVKIKLANGDHYTTGFNISDHILNGKTPQEVVTEYFVGRKYTYSNESQSEILSAEIF
jgi:lysyl-tRNA synthetase class I